jgi:hypothetical protein
MPNVLWTRSHLISNLAALSCTGDDAYRFASVWTGSRRANLVIPDSLYGLVVPRVSSHRMSGPDISWSAVDSLAWIEALGQAPEVTYINGR